MNINTTESNSKTNAQNLWKEYNRKYQNHAIATSSVDLITEPEDINGEDKIVVYLKDLEKRKEVYGICGECDEPGTGLGWCQPCNAKRFKENFRNWTSGNSDVDELIQQSQINAIHCRYCLEWIPFEKFKNFTYITRGGFGKIYYAMWPEGYIELWDIEKQMWKRSVNEQVALKSLDNSSNISTDFLNEIRSHLQIYNGGIVRCFGVTQDPNTKDYMMILRYCIEGNLRNCLNQKNMNYESKMYALLLIANGLQLIHSANKIHKDLHPGNILFHYSKPLISDLGMCQPANYEEQSVKKEGNYGVLPYMAPEILCGYQYLKAADIYSFGIIINEFISEETPYNDISHDHILAVKICKGFRPKISEDTPKLLANLIMKCWNAKVENRPTAEELYQIIKTLNEEKYKKNSQFYFQIRECENIKKNKLKNSSDENQPKNIQMHPQASYTSRLLHFKNLPEPVNSECLDCQI